VGEEFGIRWVRRPFDFPLHALAGAAPRMKQLTSSAITLLRRRFHRVLQKHGCRTSDHFAGFQITGRFRAAELVELLSLLPGGSTEYVPPRPLRPRPPRRPHAPEGKPRTGTGGPGGTRGESRAGEERDRSGALPKAVAEPGTRLPCPLGNLPDGQLESRFPDDN
jgi:hypothetical protein